ncbi:LOW QUALITY PROTEIN: DNA polymerase III subunit alpha, partial [Kutzneria sp. 744]
MVSWRWSGKGSWSARTSSCWSTLSFAVLVYASAWVKQYYPGAFCAALLRAQPMGFYSPQSLVADARRHGVTVRSVDINMSLAHATLEPIDAARDVRAVRLGIGAIRAIGADLADRVVAERDTNGPYTSMVDLARRMRMTTPQLEALATAGAFAGFGMDRRQALWAAGAAARDRPDRLPGTTMGTDAPTLPGMDKIETAVADVWATGISPDSHRSSSSGHAWTSSESSRSHACPHWSMENVWWWVARSPTDRSRRRPAASPSSTLKTRPACSTSCVPKGCGGDIATSPTAATPCSSAACWRRSARSSVCARTSCGTWTCGFPGPHGISG